MAEEVKTNEATESMDDYKDVLDKSMRELKVGDLVEGTVAGTTESEVIVDLQYYSEGVIRLLDYSADPSFSIKNDVHPGDHITAVILRMDDGQGRVLLSRREAADELAWKKFEQELKDKTTVELKITEAVKGGVVGFLDGVRAFVPASQLSLSYVEDLSTFVGKTVEGRVITADPDKKRLVVGCKDLLREKRDAERAEFVSNLKEGMVTEGTVQSLQSYGAFVSLADGVDGLVHISQITNTKRLKHPKEMLEVGQKVKVKVLSVKDGRISLSMKAVEENPEAEAEKVAEEKVVLPKEPELTTNLGSLLKNIKLN